MSVMLLETKTFLNCHTTISEGGYLVNGSKRCLFGFLDWGGYNENDTTQLQDFFTQLFRLNIQSWNGRYNDNEPENATKLLDFTQGKVVNIYQLLKHLKCIDYQIEGDDLRDTPTFEYLKKMISLITAQIVENITEYDKAEWA